MIPKGVVRLPKDRSWILLIHCTQTNLSLFLVSCLTDSWEEPADLGAKFGCSVSVGEHSFAQMEDDVDRQKLLGQSSSNHRSSHQPDLDHLTLQVQVNGPPILLALYILDRSFLIYFFFLTYKFVFLWQREAISCWVCAAMELVFIFDATGVNLSVKKAHRTLLHGSRPN